MTARIENIAVIGECMLEINLQSGERGGSIPARLAYGGDTLNTAVYLSRLGVPVDYVSALGDDSMSKWMIGQWRAEGVGCDLVLCEKGAVPGAYMIEVDDTGERSFLYWREDSPATRLFDNADQAENLFSILHGFSYVYLTGITLALYSELALARLLHFLVEYRTRGGKVIFDGNYRPQLWATVAHTQNAYQRIYRQADIALPTIGDEQMVFGQETANEIIDRIHSYGVKEVALKMGAAGCLFSEGFEKQLVESKKVNVVDTTAAGDSFNAGYLAARMTGADIKKAVYFGHNMAAEVIQHRGAIIPINSTVDISSAAGNSQ